MKKTGIRANLNLSVKKIGLSYSLITFFIIGFLIIGVFKVSEANTPKIIGGSEAQRGAWPWMAALLYAGAGSPAQAQFCGGALISPEWVLTSAHCVDDVSAIELEVILGIHDLVRDTQYVQRSVSQIIFHPSYDKNLNGDIALLHLSSPANGFQTITPNNNQALDSPGTVGKALGWGKLTDQGYYAATLHQVDLPIVSLSTANATGYFYPYITQQQLPAGYASGGKDTCEGDSGGPLVVPNASGDGWVLAGITSYGPDAGCALPNGYGIYTRVSSYYNWIVQYVPSINNNSTDNQGTNQDNNTLNNQNNSGLTIWDYNYGNDSYGYGSYGNGIFGIYPLSFGFLGGAGIYGSGVYGLGYYGGINSYYGGSSLYGSGVYPGLGLFGGGLYISGLYGGGGSSSGGLYGSGYYSSSPSLSGILGGGYYSGSLGSSFYGGGGFLGGGFYGAGIYSPSSIFGFGRGFFGGGGMFGGGFMGFF